MKLLSYQSLVESPFIIVKIGNYTFGHCSKSEEREMLGTALKVTFPNYMQSLSVVKINGTVNMYTIKMVYAITQNDDPNLLEKVFSSVSDTRKLTISYGDWASPSFIYREEEAIITKVQSSVDFSGSKINYTISCTSNALALKASNFDFSARNAKPSDVIKEILYDRKYGLLDIFYGMIDREKVNKYNLILGDDKQVTIEAKHHVNILDYLNYLVGCMRPLALNIYAKGKKANEAMSLKEDVLGDANYYMTIVDELTGELGGPYFKLVKVSNTAQVVSPDTFEVDVGYPGNNFVTAFSLRDNEQWSILYNYAQELDQNKYVYKLDNNGNMTTQYSPSITTSSQLVKTTEALKTWWTQVTQFPITASLTIKGLMRPSILMSYVRVGVYFYGNKFIASGTYIITRQQDTIDGSGYRTELTLTRIAGDKY